jgi:hypothetical protein
MMVTPMRYCWKVVAAVFVFAVTLSAQPRVTIIAGGESHGMLDACDCPQNPGGGMAKRATALRERRAKGAVLMLDAGGFSAGGIYDSYSEGRAIDSLRTTTMLRAMAALDYAAVAVGDDDLQYGGRWLGRMADSAGIALVCANCRLKDGGGIGRPFVIDTVNGIVFGITAVTTTERLVNRDAAVIIDDPVAALTKIWPRLVKQSMVRIILSHLGEKESAALAARFPDSHIIVNGHRKETVGPVTGLGAQWVMQFGFQGKQLAYLEIAADSGRVTAGANGWITIGPEVPEDPVLRRLVATGTVPGAAPREAQLDLYLMSHCPYGIPALREIMQLVESFPAMHLGIQFVGTADSSGALKSLHGAEEAADEMRWLAVEALYPRQWHAFLAMISGDSLSAAAVIAKLGLDPRAIEAWVKSSAPAALADHYRRSERLGITASPTLLWNNVPFEDDITRMRVAKRLCAEIGRSAPLCDSLPECFADRDCRKPGKTGRCGSSGRCEYVDATVFDFIVVAADTMLGASEKTAVATTSELFPGARVRIVSYVLKEGAALVKELKPAALPLYLFDAKVSGDVNFPKIESGIVKSGGWYTFREGVMRKTYFYKRDERPASIELFIDPFFPGIEQALTAVLRADSTLARTRVTPMIFGDPQDPRQPAEELLRREEALRWLVFAAKYPGQYPAYLRSYATRPGSSYWFLSLHELNMTLDGFIADVKRNGDLLQQQWRQAQDLGIVDAVYLLIDNRELAAVKNQAELERALKRVAGQ